MVMKPRSPIQDETRLECPTCEGRGTIPAPPPKQHSTHSLGINIPEPTHYSAEVLAGNLADHCPWKSTKTWRDLEPGEWPVDDKGLLTEDVALILFRGIKGAPTDVMTMRLKQTPTAPALVPKIEVRSELAEAYHARWVRMTFGIASLRFAIRKIGPSGITVYAKAGFVPPTDLVIGSKHQGRVRDRWRNVDAVRFMDYTSTNAAFSANTDLDHRRIREAGAFARSVSATPWFCIHDDLIDDSADLQGVLDTIAKSCKRTPYIELSNEPWNSIFPQFYRWDDDGSFSPAAHIVDVNRLAVAIGHTAYLAGAAIPLNSHFANPWVSRQYIEALEGSAWPSTVSPVLAVAPYIGGEIGANGELLTANEILSRLRAELPRCRGLMESHQRTADGAGIPLVAYEGGQHLVPHGRHPGMLDAMKEANASPEMGAIYEEMLEDWRQVTGGSLFCAYNATSKWTKWGCWGLAEGYDEDENSPKLRTFQKLAKKRRVTID